MARAANTVHATHSVVGAQLRQFEEALGAPAVRREDGRITGLSPLGERCEPWARQALQCASQVRTAGATASDGIRIPLATSHTYANHVLLPAMLAFRRRFPQGSIDVLQADPGEVADLVRRGKALLGITHLQTEVPRDLVSIPFLSLRQTLIAPAGHALLAAPGPTMADIAAHPLILQDLGRSPAEDVARTFAQAGLALRVAARALDCGVMKALVRAGLGVAVIPAVAYAPQRDPDLGVCDVSHLFGPLESALLLRRKVQLPPQVMAFLGFLDGELDRERVQQILSA